MDNEEFCSAYDEGYTAGLNSTIVVLVTKGKREDIDEVYIRTFDTEPDAKSFVKQIDTGPKKYWTKAQIVEDNESVDPLYDWD